MSLGFVLSPDDCLAVHGHFVPKKEYKDHLEFFEAREKSGKKAKKMDVSEIDVLMLRNDPSTDAQTTPWAETSVFCLDAERQPAAVFWC